VSYDVEALRRAEFPWACAGDSIYFNNASTGPLPQRAVRALEEWARLRAEPHRISQELQFGVLANARRLVASIIGADPREVALATNTGFGINLAAFSLPLAPGDVVLTPTREFPANVYPWMQAARVRGIEHRMIECDDGVLTPDRLAHELRDHRVRAVAVSWVQFASGATVDLAALGTLCRERGVFFVVDAIQGLGALRIDLRTAPVDIFACGAQKWLLSPWGSGFVYVRSGLLQTLEPHDVSWLGVRDSDDFSRLIDYDLTWRDDARKFEFLTLPFQDYAGMNASLGLYHELGLDAVSEHTLMLARRIVEWTEGRDDVALVTPRSPAAHAGIVSLRPHDGKAASDRLNDAGVAHSLREGAIRLSPHFYNTVAEVDRALEVIAGPARPQRAFTSP
jgi:selenocysteine lyase/cysteine desulfurase